MSSPSNEIGVNSSMLQNHSSASSPQHEFSSEQDSVRCGAILTQTAPAVRILVLDDEQLIASTLTLILRKEGYDAIAFFDPEAALKCCHEQKPALIISDVAMPNMSGIELAICLQETEPACKVLLFSGQVGTSELLKSANEQGYDFNVLAKPVSPTVLLQYVKELVAC